MNWKKRGVIWQPKGDLWWAKRYATCPTPILFGDNILRIYIQCRDEHGIGRIGFIDVDPDNPSRILKISNEPVLDIGAPGAFDDNGVFQTSVIKINDGRYFMYYVGFELCHQIRYRLLTGMAISEDNGHTFHKVKSTPILERSTTEMHFRCGPFVWQTLNHNYKMLYVAGSKWEKIDSKLMPVYDIRYAESVDGIHWPDEGQVVLEIDPYTEHGFGRPYLVKKENYYQLFYSIRKKHPCSYRMGYAESPDGLVWQRKDQELGLDVSTDGWDSESIEYAAVINIKDRTFCFYNGNDFGATGFGFAELIK